VSSRSSALGWRVGGRGACSLLVVAALAGACDDGASSEEDGATLSDGSARSCDQAPVVTYESFGRGFLTTYCNGCHAGAVTSRQGAPPDVVFDDAEQARAWADRILARSFPDDGVAPMPPAGGLVPEDADRAWIWLHCYP
jgi:cytochrome c5